MGPASRSWDVTGRRCSPGNGRTKAPGPHPHASSWLGRAAQHLRPRRGGGFQEKSSAATHTHERGQVEEVLPSPSVRWTSQLFPRASQLFPQMPLPRRCWRNRCFRSSALVLLVATMLMGFVGIRQASAPPTLRAGELRTPAGRRRTGDDRHMDRADGHMDAARSHAQAPARGDRVSEITQARTQKSASH